MRNIFKSKYTGEQIEEKLDNFTQVVANPEGSAQADLVKIQIGNYIYYLPYGTSVQGNPSTSATDELTKITIGGTTYSIPSGGSTVDSGVSLSTITGFIDNLTIYRIDGGVLTDHVLTSAETKNIRAIKFYTDGYNKITIPEGIIINSSGNIVKMGDISGYTPTEGNYYYFPLRNGICYRYYN